MLTEASVTLQQVLLPRRLKQLRESSPSELATVMRMSIPAVSQMLDRLFVLGLLTRTEAADDRRGKRVAITGKGDSLLARIRRARATGYAAGTARLSPTVRAELTGEDSKPRRYRRRGLRTRLSIERRAVREQESSALERSDPDLRAAVPPIRPVEDEHGARSSETRSGHDVR